MTNVIRKLQEERKEWEAEREHFQENHAWYESELARLQAENAKLLTAPPVAAVPAVELSAPVQAHHEQQLKLMQTIDKLRRDLLSEQERSERLESLLGGGGGDRLAASTNLDNTLACALRPAPPPEEFANLEDENLKLREELNASKEKVIELKRAAAKRSADWRSELSTITEELACKQSVEEEAASLRKDRLRLQEELGQAREHLIHRESVANAELDRLREELLLTQDRAREGASTSMKAQELDKLSQTMGQRVIELEEELERKVGGQSHLLNLFLKHAEKPVEALRVHCRYIVRASNPNGEVPNSFVPDPNDIQNSLVNIIEMLRWAEEVTEGYEDRKQRRSGYDR